MVSVLDFGGDFGGVVVVYEKGGWARERGGVLVTWVDSWDGVSSSFEVEIKACKRLICSLPDNPNRHQPTQQGCHAVVVVVSGADERDAEPRVRDHAGPAWPRLASAPAGKAVACHEPAAHGEGFPLPLPSFALPLNARTSPCQRYGYWCPSNG